VERRTGFGADLRRFLLLPPRLLFESFDLCLCRLLCGLDLLRREAGALDLTFSRMGFGRLSLARLRRLPV
jgi:hypothetical protein